MSVIAFLAAFFGRGGAPRVEPAGAAAGHDSPPAAAPAVPVLAAGEATAPSRITPAVLRALGVQAGRADQWAPILAASAAEFGITTRNNAACWLANVLQETGLLTVFAENLNYSVQGLADTWPTRFAENPAARPRVPNAKAHRLGRAPDHPADMRGIAEAVYGGRGGNGPEGSGDGWRFRGRGGIQITFRNAYEACAAGLGMTAEAVATYMETPEGAARSAGWYWRHAGLTPYGDAGDIRACRALANAGTLAIDDSKILGLAEVRAKHAALLRVLAP